MSSFLRAIKLKSLVYHRLVPMNELCQWSKCYPHGVMVSIVNISTTTSCTEASKARFTQGTFIMFMDNAGNVNAIAQT